MVVESERLGERRAELGGLVLGPATRGPIDAGHTPGQAESLGRSIPAWPAPGPRL